MKFATAALIFTSAALFLTACGAPDPNRVPIAGDVGVYWKDSRTNLCFMSTGTYPDSTNTNVPCTPEVLAQIDGLRR